MEAKIVLKQDLSEQVKENIAFSIKVNAEKFGLSYQTEADVLILRGSGNNTDFAIIYLLLCRLITCSWFTNNIAECKTYNNGYVEDVLSQADLIRERLGRENGKKTAV